MLFSKLAGIFLLFVTLVAAYPISERASSSLEARFWNGKVDPHLKTCKIVTDCKCPKKPGNKTSSTSCINGRCKCDDPVVNFIGNEFIKSVAAIGNAPITRAVGQLMAGIADAKQVLGTILGVFLGPEAKLALKAALRLRAIPDTGPSHIDKATKGFLLKGF